MIRHEHESMEEPPVSSDGCGQQPDSLLAIVVVTDDVLSLVPAGHRVVQRVWILDT